MRPALVQKAKFARDCCREIEAALITSGQLELRPSKLELQYPYGGNWNIKTGTERAVIAVSARRADDSQWVLTIQPRAPLMPRLIYRGPPPNSQLKQFEQMCYDVALLLHCALQPICPDLKWEIETDDGGLTFSGVPIPPAP